MFQFWRNSFELCRFFCTYLCASASSHKPSLFRCVRNKSSRRPNFPARARAGLHRRTDHASARPSDHRDMQKSHARLVRGVQAPPSKESVEVPNMQVVVGALFWNFGSTHWPAAGYTYWAHAQGLVLAQITSSEIVALAQKPYLSGAESRHEPWSCRELGNPPACCQVPAERDMCAYGCICVAAVATPRPLFMTSWCLRATGRRFRPRREECLRSSFSLVLPLSFLVACLRPFSPACHRRGRRHRSGCAPSSVTPWSISLTYPLHSFKRICLRVKLVPQERTSMRIDEQITNKSSKTSIKVIFQARMLQCTVGQIVRMPVPQFVEVIVDAVPM